MTTRIAHLSDLHFGETFDFDQWNSVKHVVTGFDPALLIVSGDLVDHPSPAHLLAAKCELTSLAAEAGAQLYVVAGNHDVFAYGTQVVQGRSDWFERIFDRNDTTAAETALARHVGEAPAFTRLYRDQPALTAPVRRGVRLWFRDLMGGLPKEHFTEHLPPNPPRPPGVIQPTGTPVLLALLDSNAGNQAIGFAGGSVTNADLLALATDLDRMKTAYLARIAVIHHHVLPIAFTGGRLVGAEPLMVLQNAGTVLNVLASHRFDLVLHGHKHKPQFARLDLSPADADGYPIAVAAAGSGAMQTPNNERGNCLNLITIWDSGQIVVKSVFYGDAARPDPNGREGEQVRTYREPMAVVKRRAFIRASERHRLLCERRVQHFEVTENGDLTIDHGVTELRLNYSNPKYLRRPHRVFIPNHGRFAAAQLGLDATSAKARYKVVRDPSDDGTSLLYWVTLPHSPDDGRSASYTLRHGYANSLTMTTWEAAERQRFDNPGAPPQTGWDEEWVSTRVHYPVREMEINLKLPDSLAAAQPYLRCRRHPTFPNYPIDDDYRDAEMPRDAAFVDDEEMQKADGTRLQFDAARRCWKLIIEQPIAGYIYELRWKLPDEPRDPQIIGETQWSQRLLLEMAKRLAAAPPDGKDRQAVGQFDLVRPEVETLLGVGGAAERRGVELFVYDSGRLSLRPVLSYRSWAGGPMLPGFEIALGTGIAGAAFQQRRIVPWCQQSSHSPFIEPVEVPAAIAGDYLTQAAIIAVPVYHPRLANAPRPPSWSVIGVVAFSSSSPASKVAGMCQVEPDDHSLERMQQIRGLAHMLVGNVLDCLRY